MIKVLFICHGNICRSTMSQSVFTYLVRQAGLEDCFEIDSAATSREEIGNPPAALWNEKQAATGADSADCTSCEADDAAGL